MARSIPLPCDPPVESAKAVSGHRSPAEHGIRPIGRSCLVRFRPDNPPAAGHEHVIEITKAYLEASVVYFDDEPEEESEDVRRLTSEGITSLGELNRILGIESDRNETADLDSKAMSFLISRNEGFTLSEKQRLLEMTSTKRRLQDSVKALQKVIQRARLTREIEGIIRGNGDLKKLLEKYGI